MWPKVVVNAEVDGALVYAKPAAASGAEQRGLLLFPHAEEVNKEGTGVFLTTKRHGELHAIDTHGRGTRTKRPPTAWKMRSNDFGILLARTTR